MTGRSSKSYKSGADGIPKISTVRSHDLTGLAGVTGWHCDSTPLLRTELRRGEGQVYQGSGGGSWQ